MKRFLLDTHTFLWWIENNTRFSPAAYDVLSNEHNEIFFSVISAWEISIKTALGRLHLPSAPGDFIPHQLQINSFSLLPVHLSHALRVYSLPSFHHDPFDRLLISQSLVEGLTLISADNALKKYGISLLW